MWLHNVHGLCRCASFLLLALRIWSDCEHLRGIWGRLTWCTPRPGLVKLLALSNFQARRRSRCDSRFTGHLGQLFVIIVDIFVIGASLLYFGRALFSQVFRTQWLLCPFLCTVDDLTPECSSRLWLTRSRRLFCFRICLINSFFFGLAIETECFCLLPRLWICPFRVGSADIP